MAKITFGSVKNQGVRYGWYGRGGAGKTTMALKTALRTNGKVAVLDAEGSLAPLLATLKRQGFDMDRVVTIPATNVEELLDVLRSHDSFADITAIVIDSMTTLDGWYGDYIRYHFKPSKTNGGLDFTEERSETPLKTRESFGFGKDNTAAYETNDFLLAELDKHVAAGRDIHLIMHECDVTMEDARGMTKETQPRLQCPNSGKNSIRHRVKEWLDNLGYVFRSRVMDEDGHVKSVGGRFVAFSEVGTGVPGMDGTFWSKGRTVRGIHEISDLDAKKDKPANNETTKEAK